MISRNDAKLAGLTRYFTGRACPKGHVCERMVTNTDCIDCMRERSKRYLKTEIGRIKSREQKQAAYSKYPDKYRAWSRAEYWERPENGRANSANARARAIGIVEKITGSDILLALREQNYKCLSCDYEIVDYYEVDHQIPLKLGGKNDLLNLQCLCRKCHRAKTTIDLRMAKAANVPVF